VRKSAALSSLPSSSNRKSNQLSNRASILGIFSVRREIRKLGTGFRSTRKKRRKQKKKRKPEQRRKCLVKGIFEILSFFLEKHIHLLDFTKKRTSHARLCEVILGGSWIGIFYWICAYRPKRKSLSRIAGKVST